MEVEVSVRITRKVSYDTQTVVGAGVTHTVVDDLADADKLRALVSECNGNTLARVYEQLDERDAILTAQSHVE